MKRLLRLNLILLLSLFAFGVVAPQSAFACSGGRPSTIYEIIENADFIVQGRVIQVDDSRANGVLQVELSFKGEALPQYILLGLNDPSRNYIFP